MEEGHLKGDSTTRHRPSSAGSRRPTSAARNILRPQSACSSRISEAPSVRTEPRPLSSRPSSAPSRRVVVDQREQKRAFTAMCDLIGSKASARFRTVNQCFRNMDQDCDGLVTRSEVQELFRSFHLPEDFANRFFELMDIDRSGGIDYRELQRIIGPYIQPGYWLDVPKPLYAASPRATVVRQEPISEENKMREVNLQKLINVVGSKAAQKFKTVRECFLFIDFDKNCIISRQECIIFMQTLGLPDHVGEYFYDKVLTQDGLHEEVNYNCFVQAFGNHISPGYRVPPALPANTNNGMQGSQQSRPEPPNSQASLEQRRPLSARAARPNSPGPNSRELSEVLKNSLYPTKARPSSATSTVSGSTRSWETASVSSSAHERAQSQRPSGNVTPRRPLSASRIATTSRIAHCGPILDTTSVRQEAAVSREPPVQEQLLIPQPPLRPKGNGRRPLRSKAQSLHNSARRKTSSSTSSTSRSHCQEPRSPSLFSMMDKQWSVL